MYFHVVVVWPVRGLLVREPDIECLPTAGQIIEERCSQVVIALRVVLPNGVRTRRGRRAIQHPPVPDRTGADAVDKLAAGTVIKTVAVDVRRGAGRHHDIEGQARHEILDDGYLLRVWDTRRQSVTRRRRIP